MRRLLCAAAALLPAAALGLEPRFDHRDLHGPVVGATFSYDNLTRAGASAERFRPAVRAGWGVDLLGHGSELIVGGDLALGGWGDSGEDRVLAAGHVRYRSYFGTEELKTFLDVGLYAPFASFVGAGPLVGLGVAYDFSRQFGLFGGAEFDSAFGSLRLVSVAATAGVQVRFELP